MPPISLPRTCTTSLCVYIYIYISPSLSQLETIILPLAVSRGARGLGIATNVERTITDLSLVHHCAAGGHTDPAVLHHIYTCVLARGGAAQGRHDKAGRPRVR